MVAALDTFTSSNPRKTVARMSKQVKAGMTSRVVREAVAEVTRGFDANDVAGVAEAVRGYVERTIEYRNDPRGQEIVQHPAETLRIRIGDCDDQAVLVAAMLASIGIGPLGFALCRTGGVDLSHVLTVVYVKGEWLPLETIQPSRIGQWPREVTSNEIHGLGFTGSRSARAVRHLGALNKDQIMPVLTSAEIQIQRRQQRRKGCACKGRKTCKCGKGVGFLPAVLPAAGAIADVTGNGGLFSALSPIFDPISSVVNSIFGGGGTSHSAACPTNPRLVWDAPWGERITLTIPEGMRFNSCQIAAEGHTDAQSSLNPNTFNGSVWQGRSIEDWMNYYIGASSNTSLRDGPRAFYANRAMIAALILTHAAQRGYVEELTGGSPYVSEHGTVRAARWVRGSSSSASSNSTKAYQGNNESPMDANTGFSVTPFTTVTSNEGSGGGTGQGSNYLLGSSSSGQGAGASQGASQAPKSGLSPAAMVGVAVASLFGAGGLMLALRKGR